MWARAFLALFEVFRGNFLAADVFALLAVEVDGLHVDQVDEPFKFGAGAHVELQGQRGDAELFLDLLDDRFGVGTDAVHLVDEGDARHVVALHLPVDGERLALHAADGTEDEDGAVEHAEAALHLDGEVDVARGVDDVDRVVVPFNLGGGGGDGDALLALEVHEVHLGAVAALLDLVHPVDAAAVVEHPLGQGGLPRVDVGGDADIAMVFQAFHGTNFVDSNHGNPVAASGNGIGPEKIVRRNAVTTSCLTASPRSSPYVSRLYAHGRRTGEDDRTATITTEINHGRSARVGQGERNILSAPPIGGKGNLHKA